MLAVSPCFEGEGGEFADAGTVRHDAFKASLEDKPDALALVPDEEQEGVQWAVDYVRLHAPMSDHPLQLEQKVKYLAPDFTEGEGTPDIVCGNVIFDLKWRYRDYEAQMAAYSLALMDKGYDVVKVHVLYANDEKAVPYTFDRTSAEAILAEIYAKVENRNGAFTPSEYCGWCKHKLTCPALIKQAEALRVGREDWELEQYHPSKIEDASEMAKALKLARSVIKWAESVEHHAKEMAVKKGIVPTGFKIQTRQGNRVIPNIAEAFTSSGLPQDKFLTACSVSFTNLSALYADHNAMKKAPAERELERKLGPALTRKTGSMALVENKEK
jgi:hypothetical protein